MAVNLTFAPFDLRASTISSRTDAGVSASRERMYELDVTPAMARAARVATMVKIKLICTMESFKLEGESYSGLRWMGRWQDARVPVTPPGNVYCSSSDIRHHSKTFLRASTRDKQRSERWSTPSTAGVILWQQRRRAGNEKSSESS